MPEMQDLPAASIAVPRSWGDGRDHIVLPAVILLVASLVLGGGGSPAPIMEMLLQLVAAGAVAWWVMACLRSGRPVSRSALLLASVVAALPLIQLVPLPAGVWHQLPGREAEIAALKLIGADNSWRPWSIAPDRTFASLLAMLPPLAMLVMAASLRRRERALLLAAAGVTALVSLVVGALQIRGGMLEFYGDSPALTGFQANRNTTADVLLVGLIAMSAALRLWNDGRKRRIGPLPMIAVTLALCLLFAAGVFTTGSRSGIALLAIAVPASLLLGWTRGAGRRVLIAGAAVIVLLTSVVAVGLSANRTVSGIAGRFDSDVVEFRPELWRDTRYAIDQTFPFGTGMGTFVPVMMAAERLEVVDRTSPNRAHSEYLELLLEAGVFGAGVVILVVGFLAYSGVREWRQAAPFARAQLFCASAASCIVALHSMVDYPFRSMSMACLVCAIGALMLPPPEQVRAG